MVEAAKKVGRLGSKGEVASVPLEQFLERKNLLQKNCGSPSVFKTKVLLLGSKVPKAW